ncbi:MAG TPA: nicotinate (nicotinamide) nucleotide adenylyltransferase, partial [Planctomycetota bacterium]|nr:nicotinate (nicotinamide) nucleotide adenylyltransferase [Planctomycetota bacterium]
MDGARVGWLGGSFDPVHAGHLHAARAAADALELERVLLVPAGEPPHKRDRALAAGADRLALLTIAARSDRRLQPCDVELRRPGPSYSVDTARELLDALPPGTRLYFILGADMLADLPRWRRPDELARLVTVCPVARPGTPLDVESLRAALGDEAVESIRRHVVTAPLHPASSTAIRAAL